MSPPILIILHQEHSTPGRVGFALRERGYRVDYPLTAVKVARQFQAAEDAGASLALLYGDEWPQVAVKNLATGEQVLVSAAELPAHLQSLIR